MDTFEKAKTAIAEPELSDLEQEKILFAERTAEVEAADAELKSADHAVWVCKNQRLPELEASSSGTGCGRLGHRGVPYLAGRWIASLCLPLRIRCHSTTSWSVAA